MIIDATKPVDQPFQARLQVPKEWLDRVRPEEYVPTAALIGLSKGKK